MMCGEYVPDPEECRICGQRHWDKGSKKPAKVIAICYPHFSVEDRCDDLAGYSHLLRDTVKDLLWNYRAGLNDRRSTAVGVLKRVKGRYLKWKSEWEDGKLHRDSFDDQVQRHNNMVRKKEADRKQMQSQDGHGRVDISAREHAPVQVEGDGDDSDDDGN